MIWSTSVVVPRMSGVVMSVRTVPENRPWTVKLFVAGAGISMALPTVPTAVLSAVQPAEMGKASGINNMMQRFGAVFAVAIASSVFSAYGHLGSASAVTDGFRPAIGVSALLSLIGAFTALALKPRAQPRQEVERAATAKVAA